MNSKTIVPILVMVLLILNFASASITPTTQNTQNTAAQNSVADNVQVSIYDRGDVNKDGKIDTNDAVFLREYIFSSGTAPNPLYLGDFNNDGKVNVGDVVAILNYLKNNRADNEAPVITLNYPDDNYITRTSKSYKSIDFSYSVSDKSDIAFCTLIVDGEVIDNQNNVEKGIDNIITTDLDRGDYTWKIGCIDVYGNQGYSESRDLTIAKSSSSSTGTSSNMQPISYTYGQPTITQNKQTSSANQEDNTQTTIQATGSSSTTNVNLLIPIVLGILSIIAFVIIILVLTSRKG
jgi:hypothetical protein